MNLNLDLYTIQIALLAFPANVVGLFGLRQGSTDQFGCVGTWKESK